MWAAESIYGGTWGGSPYPQEFVDFELMREMGWTFAELEATPPYVRRYCTDLMFIRREAEAREVEQARKQQGVPSA